MKKKNRAGVVMGIGILGILLWGAFYTPTVVRDYFDDRTVGIIQTRQMELSTYEVTYSDFADKMHAMGRAVEDGAHLEMFWFCDVFGEHQMSRSWEETKQRLEGEISLFLDQWLGLNEDLDDYELVFGEGYRVYGSSDEYDEIWVGNQMYWLEYQSVKEPEKIMTFLLDQDFAKIYAFGLQLPLAQSEHLIGEEGLKTDEKFFFDYWGMTQDYGIKGIETEQMVEMMDDYMAEEFGGTKVYFGDNASMEFSRILSFDKTNIYITAGILIPGN